jgi:hypothetical protein
LGNHEGKVELAINLDKNVADPNCTGGEDNFSSLEQKQGGYNEAEISAKDQQV